MTSVYVQFSDASENVIVSFFGCPQDPDMWPNQGMVNLDDVRWKVYFAALPTVAQTGSIPGPTD